MNDHRFHFFQRTLAAMLAICGFAAGQDYGQEAPGVTPIDSRAAVMFALQNNPMIRAAELGVAQAAQTLKVEEGRYPYVLQADSGYTTREIPRLAADDSVTASVARSYTLGTALRRTFPTGTTGELRVNGERFERDAVGAGVSGGRSLGEGFGLSARATLSQPLLRGAGTRVGEIELRSARVNRSLAEKTHTRLTSEIVRDVLITYWELWYATEAVEIERAALSLAERQHREAQQQVEFGALAESGLFAFETRMLQLGEAVVAVDVVRRQRALELAQLMGFAKANDAIVATSEPATVGPAVSQKGIEAALRSGSVELAELEEQVRLSRTRAAISGESVRPRLDVESYVESQGVSEVVPRAAARVAQLSWITAHVGLVFELPLANTRRQAEEAAALLAVRIAEENLRAARNQIAVQAAYAVANDHAVRERLMLAQRTLVSATQTYEAERHRFELGESLPVQVLQAEEEMRRAKLRVARARVDVAQIEADLLHLSGQLLERYG